MMTSLDARPLRLTDRYEVQDGAIYLSGLQALVRIPLDQRRLDHQQGLDTATLISGYEGSPLGGFDLEMQRQTALLDAANVTVRPAVNEELGANAVQGSQLASASPDKVVDGVVGIWYGKAPGLDRATDALRHGNLGGSDPSGGVLALVGDDSIAKSSTVPSSSEVAMAEIGMTVLVPSDPQDVLDLGLHGIALSRYCGLWTGLKLATNVVDGAATTRVESDRVDPIIPDRTVDGQEYIHEVSAHFLQPGLAALETSLVGPRPELARRYARANGLNVISGDVHGAIGIIAAGATFLDVRQALQSMGLTDAKIGSSGVKLLKLGMISPLEPTIVEEFVTGVDEVIVVEEKRPFIEHAVKDLLYGRVGAPRVLGRRDMDGQQMFRSTADLPPELIAEKIAPRLVAMLGSSAALTYLDSRKQAPSPARRNLLPLVTRTPYFCSGCPHNRSTEVPEGSLVGAGIGCSALAAFMPSDRVGDIIGFTQMGGEGASWVGMAPFVKQNHLLQNIGDGTFHHSGSLAVRGAIASGVSMTYKLLYNDAVAMTGGQAAVGKMAVPEIITELLSEGVRKIVVTTDDPRKYRKIKLPKGVDVKHRDDLDKVTMQLAAIDGVTVLIHDQECATELRRKRKRKLAVEPIESAFINERVCEGCGDCGMKSNCLSVHPTETEFGRKTKIHQGSCNKDFSCLDGDCPSFLTVKPARRARPTSKRSKTPPPIAADAFADPVTTVNVDDFNLRITGVGGTGVVTVAQVISTAATMAGLHVRSLDQMGMAQKGGAVISDIRISPQPLSGANKVGDGECDLYLGCDVLVAASETNLKVASSDRTIAIVSTSHVPTGAMVTDTAVTFPDDSATLSRINTVTRAADNLSVDARKVTESTIGHDQFANVFLIGVASQAGALPVTPALLEDALTLNGVAVDANIQAFRRGRQFVADRARVLELTYPTTTRPTPTRATVDIASQVSCAEDGELADLVTRRVGELILYQGEGYARQYAESVEKVRTAEQQRLGSTGVITLAFARHLFKLMAYKDEYEVARLSLDPTLQQEIEAQFGPGARYSYRLHPPMLRALGMKNKLTLGRWFRPVFRVLYSLRFLRGTPVDPFGFGRVRSTERELINEYQVSAEDALELLNPRTAPLVLALLELPDSIRGYEHVKMKTVDAYRESAISVLANLRRSASVPPTA